MNLRHFGSFVEGTLVEHGSDPVATLLRERVKARRAADMEDLILYEQFRQGKLRVSACEDLDALIDTVEEIYRRLPNEAVYLALAAVDLTWAHVQLMFGRIVGKWFQKHFFMAGSRRWDCFWAVNWETVVAFWHWGWLVLRKLHFPIRLRHIGGVWRFIYSADWP